MSVYLMYKFIHYINVSISATICDLCKYMDKIYETQYQ